MRNAPSVTTRFDFSFLISVVLRKSAANDLQSRELAPSLAVLGFNSIGLMLLSIHPIPLGFQIPSFSFVFGSALFLCPAKVPHWNKINLPPRKKHAAGPIEPTCWSASALRVLTRSAPIV